MTDLYLNSTNGYYDIDIATNGDFELTDGLDTSIKMSILEERRDDSVDEPSKRGGWWGNQVRTDLYELGSLLWRYYQSRLDEDTEANVQDTLFNALQWLIDDSIATNIEIDLVLTNSGVSATIEIIRNQSVIDTFFIELFENTRQ